MSTFTKGPWLHNDFQIIADDTVIANCTYGARNSNNANDARLIAAAPDLYEALKELIDMDVAYQRGQKVSDAVDKARAALAKADGKQS